MHYNTSAGDAAELVSLIEELGCRAIAIPGNLQEPASWPGVIQRTVETLGAVDILVNNASTFLTKSPDTLDGFSLDDWDVLGRDVPCLVDLKPSGRFLMEEFYYAGGLPALMARISDRLHLEAATV